MKFTINNSGENVATIMRKIGYFFLPEGNNQPSFVRPLRGQASFPRFHVYLEVSEKIITFSLHLDQKKPSYAGTAAHNGEYEGELVMNEAERIKQILERK